MATTADDTRQPVVYEQFEDLDQQQESYTVGMWSFIVTEVMFFGALFLIYTVYRWKYQPDFYAAHKGLDYVIGGINTTILLASSLFVALAVHFAMRNRWKPVNVMLGLTVLCASAFVVIKLIWEWFPKFDKGLFPGPGFVADAKYGDPARQELFYSMYFAFTGLHALHVVIGIGVFIALMVLIWRRNRTVTDYVPVEMVGLYWHFVDLVWIFLYPLFYLMPK